MAGLLKFISMLVGNPARVIVIIFAIAFRVVSSILVTRLEPVQHLFEGRKYISLTTKKNSFCPNFYKAL